MKFDGGRKKNQLIWGFILKDIASQSSVFNKTRGATWRLGRGTCKTRALGAPRARSPGARRNASACHRAWVRLAISIPRLGVARSLVDKVVGSVDQVHSVD